MPKKMTSTDKKLLDRLEHQMYNYYPQLQRDSDESKRHRRSRLMQQLRIGHPRVQMSHLDMHASVMNLKFLLEGCRSLGMFDEPSGSQNSIDSTAQSTPIWQRSEDSSEDEADMQPLQSLCRITRKRKITQSVVQSTSNARSACKTVERAESTSNETPTFTIRLPEGTSFKICFGGERENKAKTRRVYTLSTSSNSSSSQATIEVQSEKRETNKKPTSKKKATKQKKTSQQVDDEEESQRQNDEVLSRLMTELVEPENGETLNATNVLNNINNNMQNNYEVCITSEPARPEKPKRVRKPKQKMQRDTTNEPPKKRGRKKKADETLNQEEIYNLLAKSDLAKYVEQFSNSCNMGCATPAIMAPPTPAGGDAGAITSTSSQQQNITYYIDANWASSGNCQLIPSENVAIEGTQEEFNMTELVDYIENVNNDAGNVIASVLDAPPARMPAPTELHPILTQPPSSYHPPTSSHIPFAHTHDGVLDLSKKSNSSSIISSQPSLVAPEIVSNLDHNSDDCMPLDLSMKSSSLSEATMTSLRADEAEKPTETDIGEATIEAASRSDFTNDVYESFKAALDMPLIDIDDNMNAFIEMTNTGHDKIVVPPSESKQSTDAVDYIAMALPNELLEMDNNKINQIDESGEYSKTISDINSKPLTVPQSFENSAPVEKTKTCLNESIICLDLVNHDFETTKKLDNRTFDVCAKENTAFNAAPQDLSTNTCATAANVVVNDAPHDLSTNAYKIHVEHDHNEPSKDECGNKLIEHDLQQNYNDSAVVLEYSCATDTESVPMDIDEEIANISKNQLSTQSEPAADDNSNKPVITDAEINENSNKEIHEMSHGKINEPLDHLNHVNELATADTKSVASSEDRISMDMLFVDVESMMPKKRHGIIEDEPSNKVDQNCENEQNDKNDSLEQEVKNDSIDLIENASEKEAVNLRMPQLILLEHNSEDFTKLHLDSEPGFESSGDSAMEEEQEKQGPKAKKQAMDIDDNGVKEELIKDEQQDEKLIERKDVEDEQIIEEAKGEKPLVSGALAADNEGLKEEEIVQECSEMEKNLSAESQKEEMEPIENTETLDLSISAKEGLAVAGTTPPLAQSVVVKEDAEQWDIIQQNPETVELKQELIEFAQTNESSVSNTPKTIDNDALMEAELVNKVGTFEEAENLDTTFKEKEAKLEEAKPMQEPQTTEALSLDKKCLNEVCSAVVHNESSSSQAETLQQPDTESDCANNPNEKSEEKNSELESISEKEADEKPKNPCVDNVETETDTSMCVSATVYTNQQLIDVTVEKTLSSSTKGQETNMQEPQASCSNLNTRIKAEPSELFQNLSVLEMESKMDVICWDFDGEMEEDDALSLATSCFDSPDDDASDDADKKSISSAKTNTSESAESSECTKTAAVKPEVEVVNNANIKCEASTSKATTIGKAGLKSFRIPRLPASMATPTVIADLPKPPPMVVLPPSTTIISQEPISRPVPLDKITRTVQNVCAVPPLQLQPTAVLAAGVAAVQTTPNAPLPSHIRDMLQLPLKLEKHGIDFSPNDVCDGVNVSENEMCFNRGVYASKGGEGLNYGPATIDVAKTFGVTCLPYLVEKCFAPSACTLSHKYRDPKLVENFLDTLNDVDLSIAYKFMYHHERLYQRYFNVFCKIYTKRDNRAKLINMVNDCERYGDAQTMLHTVFYALGYCGYSKVNACRQILNRSRNRTRSNVDALVAIIMEADWTMFCDYIESFTELPNYHFRISVLNQMAPVVLRANNPRLAEVFFKCLVDLEPDEVGLVQHSPAMLQWLELTKSGKMCC